MSGNICEEDGNDIGTYEYKSTTHKITLYFDDLTAPEDGHQVEVWNNVQLTSSTLFYTWDEDDNGLDEWSVTYKK